MGSVRGMGDREIGGVGEREEEGSTLSERTSETFPIQHDCRVYLSNALVEIHRGDNDSRYRLTDCGAWCIRGRDSWIVLRRLDNSKAGSPLNDSQLLQAINALRGYVLKYRCRLIKGKHLIGHWRKRRYTTSTAEQLKILKRHLASAHQDLQNEISKYSPDLFDV